MDVLIEAGEQVPDAAGRVSIGLKGVVVNIDGDVDRVAAGSGLQFSASEILDQWRTAETQGTKPSWNRYVAAAQARLYEQPQEPASLSPLARGKRWINQRR